MAGMLLARRVGGSSGFPAHWSSFSWCATPPAICGLGCLGSSGRPEPGYDLLVRKFWLVVEQNGIRDIIHVFTYGVIIFELMEMFILYVFLNFLNAAPGKGVALGEFVIPNGTKLAYDYVVNGELSGWFWVGVILIGLAIPFLLSLISLVARRWELSLASTKFVLIVTGGVILRFVIVWGGDLSAPLPFPPANFPIPLLGG